MKTIAIIMLLVGLVSIAEADGPYDYAARWYAWDVSTRIAYVTGVTDGICTAFFTTIGNLDKKPSGEERLLIMDILKFGSAIERKKIIEVMTDIYKDPANSYIETTKIFIFAHDKIEGKDISKALEIARGLAYDEYKARQRLK